MPQDLLAFPAYYTVVGVYRLATDPIIRKAVWDKVKHATLRGIVASAVWTTVTYPWQRWFVRLFLVGKRSTPGVKGVDFALGWLREMDAVEYTTILFVLPQITYILNYFLRRNLLIARSRAYDITVKSRNKPDSFWSKGYVEEWQQPPRPINARGAYGKLGIEGKEQEKWLQWVLWWPSQMALRHFLLIPLSPHLPIINVFFTSAMKALYTARTLHRPYFEVKQMSSQEVEIWLEERKWGYRGFGFAAAFLESLPIIGLGFSVSNRIGAAMWAFDLEKRQHRFASGELKPLRPNQTSPLPPALPERPQAKKETETSPPQPPPLPPRDTPSLTVSG